jgi:hypothetical protein
MLKLHRLGRKYLDFEFTVRDEARLRIIERPGLWMAPARLATILEELRAVVRTTIPQGLDYGVLSAEKRRLDNAIISILYESRSRRPIAFNAYSLLRIELHGRPADVLHLGLVMVDPAYQIKGYTWVVVGLPCLLVFLRNGLQPVWVTNVSQVPAIIGKVAEAFGNVFPSPFAGTRRTYNHLEIARQVVTLHRSAFGVGIEAEFDAESFVIRNAYTGGSDNLRKTFAETMQHRDQRANAMCADTLDYSRGDDFLQVGSIDAAHCWEYLLRDVPRDSLPLVLARAGFVLLERSLLPLLHWFSPQRQWGDLRPWRP